MWPNPWETADLVTFTEEILIEKLHFLCSRVVEFVRWDMLIILAVGFSRDRVENYVIFGSRIGTGITMWVITASLTIWTTFCTVCLV